MIQPFDLDERALVYVQEHLVAVNTFCSALASRIGEREGRLFTVAPAGTPTDRLYRFTEGGLLAESGAESRRVEIKDGWMVRVDHLKAVQAAMISDTLRDAPGGSCVVDDFNPVWDDPRREYDLGETAFGVGAEVYHWFDRRHHPETIRLALQQADTIWHGVSAVSERPAPVDGPPTRDWLIGHAAGAIAIFCSAYDGEGFIGWRSEQA